MMAASLRIKRRNWMPKDMKKYGWLLMETLINNRFLPDYVLKESNTYTTNCVGVFCCAPGTRQDFGEKYHFRSY